MDKALQAKLDKLHTPDRQLQSQAYTELIEATKRPVDWAYQIWDQIVADLAHPDNLVRSVAAQVLCNLAKSDPEQRMLRDFDALLNVTRDDRFVTARHCMQNIWKVGAAGEAQKKLLLKGLTQRFRECITEKNGTLIRYDILQTLRNLYNHGQDERVKATALSLIATEEDPKYRKKYATLWRGV